MPRDQSAGAPPFSLAGTLVIALSTIAAVIPPPPPPPTHTGLHEHRLTYGQSSVLQLLFTPDGDVAH